MIADNNFTHLKTILKFLLKTIAISIEVFLIVLSTASIPRIVKKSKNLTYDEINTMITKKPMLGYPIPFFIIGDCSAFLSPRNIPPKTDLDYPFHIDPLCSPLEATGAGIDSKALLLDFLILFIPLFVLFLARSLYTKRKRFSGKHFIKTLLLLFPISVIVEILTVFIHPLSYYRIDIEHHIGLSLGLPLGFIDIWLPSNVHTFPYHLPLKVIVRTLAHTSPQNFSIVYFRGNVLIIFAIITLLYYAYSNN